MNISDWKIVTALGCSVIAIIFVSKLDADALERVSIHGIDAIKELAVANSNN